jgi:hypothetical protein
LGDFIRKNDTRVKRTKSKNGIYFYYLAKLEYNIAIEDFNESVNEYSKKENRIKKSYQKRDLHKLLSRFGNYLCNCIIRNYYC